MTYEFRLPDVGEGIAEAEIVRWLIQDGDEVQLDQPLVEIQTDKAVVEVPAPVAGRVLRRGGREGETLHVGDLLVALDEQDGSAPVAPTVAGPVDSPGAAPRAPVPAVPPGGRPLASPAVRKLARELRVELTTVRGTGRAGQITAEDVRGAGTRTAATGAEEASEPATPQTGLEAQLSPATAFQPGPADERVPLRGLRRKIAEAMAESWRTIPHVTGMDEVEVSALVALRQQLQGVAEAEGLHLTYLPFIVKAASTALKQYPIVNSYLDEAAGEIVYRRRYNIGIATATQDGLIVPVLHDADRKTLRELQREIADLTEQARARHIGLAALQGGSFTITNFGALGGWMAAPIIRPGEAAILGVGRIQERPWVVDGRLEVRPVLALSLSADHRLIDGDIATAFMNTVAGYLRNPLSLLLDLA